MNMNIIYEPYVFSFILSLIISIVYYVYEKNKTEDDDDDDIPKDNLLAKSIVALLLSYIIIMILYYSYKYVTFEFKSSLPMIGGSATVLRKEFIKKDENDIEDLNIRREKMMERLTIVDDDIDVSILED